MRIRNPWSGLWKALTGIYFFSLPKHRRGVTACHRLSGAPDSGPSQVKFHELDSKGLCAEHSVQHFKVTIHFSSK